jgi:hypothetical protein
MALPLLTTPNKTNTDMLDEKNDEKIDERNDEGADTLEHVSSMRLM